MGVEPQRVNCPFGTVPIRRISKDDLIRAKLQKSQVFSSNYNYEPSTPEIHGLHLAVLRAKHDGSPRYNGGDMRVSVEKLHTEAYQYSLGRMEVGNGPDIVQVGSMVNPDLYGDDQTRGFISFRTSGSSSFNTLCSGFILVTEQFPIDAILAPVSERVGKYSVYETLIYRDKYSGSWWLKLGSKHIQVGFCPQRLFSSLKDLASNVEWGGEVLSPPDKKSPEMVSGHHLRHVMWIDAFIDRLTTINGDGDVVDVNKQL